MSKRRRFKDKVNALIDNDAYLVADFWANMKDEDQVLLLQWAARYTQYKDVNAGVVCLMSVRRIFEVIEQAERRFGYMERIQRTAVERIRGQIKRKIKRDVRREEYEAHQRARRVRTV